ncbi:unnamed protein product [Taenia asiatica]|uniref:Pept_C1 domain-containing protein n=1 Tax=Taenia asiatica TaxID=60517 RepID=A0A0R3WDE0_TAEAS|nr:unnamed protein product [Taenia asiatica]
MDLGAGLTVHVTGVYMRGASFNYHIARASGRCASGSTDLDVLKTYLHISRERIWDSRNKVMGFLCLGVVDLHNWALGTGAAWVQHVCASPGCNTDGTIEEMWDLPGLWEIACSFTCS